MNKHMLGNLQWVVIISVLCLSVFIIPEAHSVPAGFTSANATANDGYHAPVTHSYGPLPAGASADADSSFSGINSQGFHGTAASSVTSSLSMTSSALVDKSFDSIVATFAGVGSVSGEGSAINNAPTMTTTASSGGSSTFYYGVGVTKGLPSYAPSLDILQIPITFTASGEITITSTNSSLALGNADVSVYTDAPGFTAGGASASIINSVGSKSFTKTATLMVPIGTVYSVSLYGSGSVSASSVFEYDNFGEIFSSRAEYVFAVDPTFMFDQAAFDLLYGVNSFDLNEYFAFNFSPNLDVQQPVPEPSTILLLGSGLAGLVGYGRRRMKKWEHGR